MPAVILVLLAAIVITTAVLGSTGGNGAHGGGGHAGSAGQMEMGSAGGMPTEHNGSGDHAPGEPTTHAAGHGR